MHDTTKRLVLLDTRTKEGRGAWFDLSHWAALAKVAGELGHLLVEVDTAKLDQLAPDLPAGKVNPHGKPDTLPVVPQAVIERLAALVAPSQPDGTAAPPVNTKTNAPPAVSLAKAAEPTVPIPWSQVATGSVVLASDVQDDGWWECIVEAVEAEGDTLVLRWRDFPGLDTFRKPLARVGILPQSGLR